MSQPDMVVHLWSDGPASQFKNRYMYHALTMFREKLKLLIIDWNFFATSHGKGCIDGIGGSVKRMVWQLVRSRKANVKTALEFAAALTLKETKISIHVIKDPEFIYLEVWQTELSNAPKVILSLSITEDNHAIMLITYESSFQIQGIKLDHCWLISKGNVNRNTLSPKQSEKTNFEDAPKPVSCISSQNTRLSLVSRWAAVVYHGKVRVGVVTKEDGGRLQLKFMKETLENK